MRCFQEFREASPQVKQLKTQPKRARMPFHLPFLRIGRIQWRLAVPFWKVSGTKDIYEDDPEVVARAEQITATLGGVGSFRELSCKDPSKLRLGGPAWRPQRRPAARVASNHRVGDALHT